MAGVEIENLDVEKNIIIARQEDIIALPFQEDEGYFSEEKEMCDNTRFNAHFPDDGDIESDPLLHVTPFAEFKAKKSDVGGLKKIGDACWIRYKVKQVEDQENTIQVDCWQNSSKVEESCDAAIRKNLLMMGNRREMIKRSFKPLGACFLCKECGKVAPKTMRIKHLLRCLKRKKDEKKHQSMALLRLMLKEVGC